jgi:hypothetical protein
MGIGITLGPKSRGAIGNLITKIIGKFKNSAVCVFVSIKFAKARDCRAKRPRVLPDVAAAFSF